MAKRFIDTELFDDPWFMDLSKDAKILWIYLITKCNHAGIIDINPKLVGFQTGIKSYETVSKQFNNRLIHLRDSYYFIPKFIEFQYPDFPRSNVRQQQGAIKILESFGLFKDGNLTVSKDLVKSYGNDNDNVYINKEDKIKKLREWYRKQIELSNNNKEYISFCKFLFENNDFKRPLKEVLNLTEQIGWEHFQVLQCKIELMREKSGYAGTLKQKVLGYVNGGYRKSKFFGTMDSWITGDANKKNIQLPDNDTIRKSLIK